MNQQLLVTMLCNVHCIEPFEMKVNTFDLLVLQKSCSFFCWQCLLEDFSFLLLEVFAGGFLLAKTFPSSPQPLVSES